MTDLKIFNGRCQFCLRGDDEVSRLIAGKSASICDDCVERCRAALHDSPAEKKPEPSNDRYLHRRLAKHFAPLPPQELFATSRTYPLRQQADLQGALDDLLRERHIPSNFVGIHHQYRHESPGFSKLLEQGHSPIEAAPAQYEEVAIGDGDTVRCLKNGVWLLTSELGPYVIVLVQENDFHGGGELAVEIAAPPGEAGAALCTAVYGIGPVGAHLRACLGAGGARRRHPARIHLAGGGAQCPAICAAAPCPA